MSQASQLSLFDEMPAAPKRKRQAKQEHPPTPPPVFWIEELRLLRDLEATEASEIRRIAFRRGLNIVWTPAILSDDENAHFTGHAAGKTSLCRLIRYVLGESVPGNQFLRERLRNSFPDGWVLARVWVLNKPWVIARPLAGRQDSVCLADTALEVLAKAEGHKQAQDYEIFRVTLHHTVVDPLPVQTYGDSGQAIRFLHVLAWLARDQECRFVGLLSWRHAEPQSSSPSLTAVDKRFLVRSLLGLMDEDILREIEHRVTVEIELKRLPEQIAFRQQAVKEAVDELNGYLPKSHQQDVPDPLFIDAVRHHLAHHEARELGALGLEAHTAEEANVRSRYEALLEKRGAARQQRDHLHAALDVRTQDAGIKVCSIPLAIAKEACPLHTQNPKQGELDPIETLRQTLNFAVRLLEETEAKVEAAATELEDLRASRAALEKQAEAIRQRYQGVRDRMDRALAAEHSLQALMSMKEGLTSEITASHERQESLQRRWHRALSQISGLYRQTIKRLLGPDVEAQCHFTREEIQLKAQLHGDLNSAAIDTLITLSFDLTALQAGIHGAGFHPRFLLHDSPREADMDANLYHRLFRLARSLEDTAGQTSFQYIITTTEAPPNTMQTEPWLRLTLDASEGEKRLYGRDL